MRCQFHNNLHTIISLGLTKILLLVNVKVNPNFLFHRILTKTLLPVNVKINLKQIETIFFLFKSNSYKDHNKSVCRKGKRKEGQSSIQVHAPSFPLE